MSARFGEDALASQFNELTPEHVFDAVERSGYRCSGRFVILNSYENRVYQLGMEEGPDLVGKFYRPGRWNEAQLLDEHDFVLELEDAGVPVVAPLALTEDGETLGALSGTAAGIRFALYPRISARSPHEFNDVQLRRLGEELAQLHDVGEDADAPHRLHLTPQTYGRNNLEYLLEGDTIPDGLRRNFEVTVEAFLDRIEPLFGQVPTHRIHGDCHRANLLWTEDGPLFLDFDDMLIGPAVQDVWMLVPSYDAEGDRQRQVLLDAYRELRDFDPAWLQLIEPLRGLRFINYATWIARRWHDPSFKRAFAHFGDMMYWQRELMDLREQIARLDSR